MTFINTVCTHCQSTFKQRNLSEKKLKKFCNLSCAASYNNQRKPKKERPIRNCLTCGKELQLRQPSDPKKYCGVECSSPFVRPGTLARAEASLVQQATTLKRVITQMAGYACVTCGITQWQDKPISLHLDHIDGNSDNNSLDNLRLLCPNCHSQTDTYCSRNKKNSKRATYMQRYRKRKLGL